MLAPRFGWRLRSRPLTVEGLTGWGLAVLGGLPAVHLYPVTLNTIGGPGLFATAAAAGIGAGLGLAFSLHGAWQHARQIWLGAAFGLGFLAGAGAIHWNAESPNSPRYVVRSRVVEEFVPHGRRRGHRSLAFHDLRRIEVEWQGAPLRIGVERERGRFAEGSALLLSVYEGRLGYPVIERVERAAP